VSSLLLVAPRRASGQSPATPMPLSFLEINQAVLAKASSFDASVLSPAEAGEVVVQIGAIEGPLASMKALAAARAAEAGSFHKEGFRSPADQLADQLKTGPTSARRTLETGRRLGAQPEVAKAALSGELSPEQTALVAEGVAADPTKAAELIAQARSGSLGELGEQVARVKAAVTDQEARRRAIHARRHLRRWADRDGALQGHLYGHVEDGASLWRMLDPIRRRLAARRDERRAGAPTSEAGAGSDTGASDTGASEAAAGRGRSEREPFEALDYDALVAIAEIAAGGSGELSLEDLLELGLFPQLEASMLAGPRQACSPARTAQHAGGDGPPPGAPAGPPQRSEGPDETSTASAPQRGEQSPGTASAGARAADARAADARAAGSDDSAPPPPAPTRARTGTPPLAAAPAVQPPAPAVQRPSAVSDPQVLEPSPSEGDELVLDESPALDETAPPGSEAAEAPVDATASPGATGPPAGPLPVEAPPPERPPRARLPKLAGSPNKVIVRVDLDAVLRGVALEGELCEIVGYGPVPLSVIDKLTRNGNAFLVGVLTRHNEVLGVYHHRRRANAYQQSALELCYPACAARGCSAKVGLQNDHREDWSKTHFTVFDLLDRLCPHHHRLKTEHNWALVEGTGKRAFVPPDDPRHPRHAGGAGGAGGGRATRAARAARAARVGRRPRGAPASDGADPP